jgi:hypothetical protein
MVEMQVGAKDVGDVLEAHARGAEILEPGLLGEVVRRGIALTWGASGQGFDSFVLQLALSFSIRVPSPTA